MLIYLVVLLLVCIIVMNITKHRVPIKSQNTLLVILFVILLFMITFRGINVGTDYIHHSRSFLYSTNLSFLSDSWINSLFNEPLWYSLFYIININGYSIVLFWLLYFCLVWFFLIKSTPKRCSRLLVCSVFVLGYFYYSSYNTSAQILAATLILCSIKEWNQQGRIFSIIYYVAALLIHKSSIFVIPFFVLNFISFHKKWYYLGFALCFLIVSLRLDSLLFSRFNDLMLLYDQSSSMSDYNKYFEMEASGLNVLGIAMNYFIIISNICIFILFHYRDDAKLDIYSQWWAIGIIIYILTFNYAWLFRLSYFFMMSMIIAIPRRMKHNSKCIIAILLLCLVYICKLYNNNDGIVPYEIIDKLN